MGTFIIAIIASFISIIAYRMIMSKREKKVSVVVMSTDEVQAYTLFKKQVGKEIPKEFLKTTPQVGQTAYSFTIKK